MLLTSRNTCLILALCVVLSIPACGGSDPQSPATVSSISGTVVFDQTESPAAGVDVVLEQRSGNMMMEGHWDQAAHMMTNSHGQFHFEYMRDAMRRYRVGVSGVTERHMCDPAGSDEEGLVLHVPFQAP